jgi:hypothetical protein
MKLPRALGVVRMMRFAGSWLTEAPGSNSADHEESAFQRFGALPAQSGEQGPVAMTRGQARGIIDKLSKEAVRGNITPNMFQSGLGELSRIGNSPDYSRRLIRNALATPATRLAIENPELARDAIHAFGSVISKAGANPMTVEKNFDAANVVLQQAKKDNLLRSDVTSEETRREIQQPMAGALHDWVRQNMNDPKIQRVLSRSGVGSNRQWGPRGYVPIAAGYSPERFGVSLTPEALKQVKEGEKRAAWERSPEGRKQLAQDRAYAEQLKRSIDNTHRLHGLGKYAR